jgi:dihydrofolate synthase / folylpolyglutamate synthase
MSSKNYRQTIDYLFSQLPMYQRVGNVAFKKDLTNTIELCGAVGNPHKKLKCIHVAGTNGKGSVSHIIASVLQENGYKVGLYTSPHYKDFRERIKINGQYISEKSVIDFVENNKVFFEKIKPSFFEMTVVMAFDYFLNETVDYAVIEVGLGGRLDSTNVINPLLSVITNISYDHTEMLGNTLAEIAFEKAGIIKPDVPVIIGEKHEETTDVFVNQAKINNSKIIFSEDISKIISSEINGEYQIIDLEKKKIATDLIGNYQSLNMRTSLTALEYIQKHKIIAINNKSIINGIKKVRKNTGLIGRFQLISKNPSVIIDSAHNEGGIKVLFQQIKSLTYEALHIIIGTVNDKDISKILSLLPTDANYYFCKADIPRGLDAINLREIAATFNLKGNAYTSVNEAYMSALKNAESNDLVLVTGSIFVVAEVI